MMAGTAAGWVPAALWRWLGVLLRRRVRFAGCYGSWSEAQARSRGYDAVAILEQARAAARSVIKGDCTGERDGIPLEDVTMPFPLIAVVFRAAQENAGQVRVVDFGGALGSSYYQCCGFLGHVPMLRWHVVEQPMFVECGRREFQTDILRFESDMDSCKRQGRPQIVLFSGVLQYLPEPARTLSEAADMGADYIIIDRTPLLRAAENTLAVQIVPRRFGRASYPVWLFSKDKLLASLSSSYRMVASFDAVDGVMDYRLKRVDFKGFIFHKADL